MPGNPKTSKWFSPTHAMRKRKPLRVTIGDEAHEQLEKLAGPNGNKSSIIERLILATKATDKSAR